MIYIFSATINGKIYWYKSLEELPIIDGANITYHIYPVYQIGNKEFNLGREKLILEESKFSSHYFHLERYLKGEHVELHSLFISGSGEFTNVFFNDEAYVHYNIVTHGCYRISF